MHYRPPVMHLQSIAVARNALSMHQCIGNALQGPVMHAEYIAGPRNAL